jgi:hypothetical protein
LLAVFTAAISALVHLDARRWPVESIFVGAIVLLLGPIWGAGVVLTGCFARWCVVGRPGFDRVALTEVIPAAIAASAASFSPELVQGPVFLVLWLALRRTPLGVGLTLGFGGLVLAGLASELSPMWVVAGVVPAGLVLLIANAEKLALQENREVLHALTVMLQRAHPYTHAHIERVARIAERTALHLGLSPVRAQLVHRAARLHDVGKIAVDEGILDKPARLTSEEYAHVQLHASFGATILEEIEDMRLIADWIRCHHERPDGNGYPRGLRSSEIPIEAKIIAAADAFDAMTGGYFEGEKRPYRDPVSPDAALAELERCAGSQFDPQVVSAFRKALREEGNR